MDVGPLEFGAAGLVVGGVVAILLAAVVATIIVFLLWAVALTVVTPVMGGAAAKARRARRRAWLRAVRKSWLTLPEKVETPRPPVRHRWPIRGVGVMSVHDTHADTQLLAAEVAPTATTESEFASMAVVHARLQASEHLELPGHPYCSMVVYVLSGRGTVGSQGRPIRAGQLALHGRHIPVQVASRVDGQAPPLDVLVVPLKPAEKPMVVDGPVVMPIGADMRHRIKVLQALTADIPTAEPTTVPVLPTAPVVPQPVPVPAA